MTDLIPARDPRSAAVDLRQATTDSWTDVVRDVVLLAENIASTEFVPPSLRGSVPKTTAAVLYGRELGLPPMTALGGVHVIQGRAGISAELMRALILRDGHELHIAESTEIRCILRGRRRGQDEWTSASYTMAEATRSGDAKRNPQYAIRPAEMLFARATSRLARMIFPDVTHGMASVDELDAEAATPPTPPAIPAASPEPVTVSRSTSRRGSSGAAGRSGRTVAPPPSTADEGGSPAVSGPAAALPPAPNPIPEPDPAPEPQPAPPAEPTTPTPMIGAGQRALIMGHWARLGITERDERLYWTGHLVGGEIGSTNALTRAQAKTLIDALSAVRDRETLESRAAADTSGED